MMKFCLFAALLVPLAAGANLVRAFTLCRQPTSHGPSKRRHPALSAGSLRSLLVVVSSQRRELQAANATTAAAPRNATATTPVTAPRNASTPTTPRNASSPAANSTASTTPRNVTLPANGSFVADAEAPVEGAAKDYGYGGGWGRGGGGGWGRGGGGGWGASATSCLSVSKRD
jgi:hypothetical protein